MPTVTPQRRDVRMDTGRVRLRGALGLFFELQPGLVFFHEGLYVVGSAQETVPLLVVESDGEPAQAVDADAAFFSDFEDEVSAALFGFDFFFELRQFGFEFFVGWF